MNQKLNDTAKAKKMAVVSISVDGRHLDPPGSALAIEIPVNREYFDMAYKFAVQLLDDRNKKKTENG